MSDSGYLIRVDQHGLSPVVPLNVFIGGISPQAKYTETPSNKTLPR